MSKPSKNGAGKQADMKSISEQSESASADKSINSMHVDGEKAISSKTSSIKDPKSKASSRPQSGKRVKTQQNSPKDKKLLPNEPVTKMIKEMVSQELSEVKLDLASPISTSGKRISSRPGSPIRSGNSSPTASPKSRKKKTKEKAEDLVESKTEILDHAHYIQFDKPYGKQIQGIQDRVGKKVPTIQDRKEIAELQAKIDLEAAKIVRFIPRTEEELLGEDVQQRRERKTKADVLHGLGVQQNISDASDIEMNMEPKKLNSNLFKFDLQLGPLNAEINSIKEIVDKNYQTVHEVKEVLHAKTPTKLLAQYIERISHSIKKECGEPPHQFKLDDRTFSQTDFNSPDDAVLRSSIERLVEKFDVINMNLLKFKKHSKSTEQRLRELEDNASTYMTTTSFWKKNQEQTSELLEMVENQLQPTRNDVKGLTKTVNNTKMEFSKEVNDAKSETLWRIQDAEELIKTRISEAKVETIRATLETQCRQTIENVESKITTLVTKVYGECSVRSDLIEKNSNKSIADTNATIMSELRPKLDRMLIASDITSLKEKVDNVKRHCDTEFEQFQQYLRDEKKQFGELYTKVRQLDKDFSLTQTKLAGEFGQDFSETVNSSKAAPQMTHKHQNSNQKDRTPLSASLAGNTIAAGLSNQLNGTMLRKTQSMNTGEFVKAVDLDGIVTDFSGQIGSLDTRLSEMFEKLLEKADKSEIGLLTADKIRKDELQELMPDMEVLEARIKSHVMGMFADMQKTMFDNLRANDEKMVGLRKSMDIEGIMKKIHNKANAEQVSNDLSNHEFKIGTLDTNVMAIASDFESFQNAVNKISIAVTELQDVNKDVLLGKKSLNCLSCGKDEVMPALPVTGSDGRVYMTRNKGNFNAIGSPDMAEMKTDSSQKMLMGGSSSLGTIYQSMRPKRSRVQSANTYKRSAPQVGSSSGQIELSNSQQNLLAAHAEKQKRNIAGGGFTNEGRAQTRTMRNSNQHFSNQLDDKSQTTIGLMQEDKHFPSSLPTSTRQRPRSGIPLTSVLNQNSLSNRPKQKLPFGYMVQQEKKELLKMSKDSNTFGNNQ